MGEVFKEINKELEIDQIKPISQDQDAMENILKAAEERVINVSINQQKMVKTFEEQELLEEKEFLYEVIIGKKRKSLTLSIK